MNLTTLPAALAHCTTVLEPDKNSPEWWAGAPSVVTAEDGMFYLAARMREGDSPRGRRGYEIRLLQSTDGIHFSPIHHIRREEAGVIGFERPCLRIDPGTKRFKLYGCTLYEQGWGILKFDDVVNPRDFDPRTARPVLTVENSGDDSGRINDYKDPVLLWNSGQWHMFVIAADKLERIRHFASVDGESWRPVNPTPMMENTGWHNYYTRPAAILPVPVGYLFVYEGSNVNWADPAYNIATGMAYSPDLDTVVDLTPDKPLLMSTTPGLYHTWRYSEWILRDNKLYVYFEAARPNNTNEIRVSVLEVGGVLGSRE